VELKTQKEYHLFYKGECEESERKRADEVKRLADEIKELCDQRDDKDQRLTELEENRKFSESHIKNLELELSTAKQDVMSLTKMCDEFKQQFDVLTDKEAELREKNREYAMKMQDYNLEKDKSAHIEKKLQREIEKLMDEHREEMRTRAERYEKMLKRYKKQNN
jgi:chromosome segregation ATPase